MEKKTLNTKISHFFVFHISNSLHRLLFRNLLSSQDSSSAQRTFHRRASSFSFFVLQLPLSVPNCPTHSVSLQVEPVLGSSALSHDHVFFFFFSSFFFTLQNYNSIHIFFKFKVLLLSPFNPLPSPIADKKAIELPLIYHFFLRLII